MKKYFRAYLMCRSMFCAIPSPQIWDEENRDKLLLFLPLVGLELGIYWALIAWICRLLALPSLVTGIFLCACPYLLTGFLHLDGYMDVVDAVRSCRDLERKREILKDSHVGSFAVIGLALLLLAQFALFASAPNDAELRVLILIPIVSRCCSALAVTLLKPMRTSQYAGRRKSRAQVVVLSAALCGALALGFLLFGKYGFSVLACAVGYAKALLRAYKSLNGMNGDISGYALTIGELCAVAVYALI